MLVYEEGSGEGQLELASAGSGSPPPPPAADPLLDLILAVSLVAGVLFVFVCIFGWIMVWEEDYVSRPGATWLVWNGDWYRLRQRSAIYMQKQEEAKQGAAETPAETPAGTRKGQPQAAWVGVRRPGEELRPLIYAKP